MRDDASASTRATVSSAFQELEAGLRALADLIERSVDTPPAPKPPPTTTDHPFGPDIGFLVTVAGAAAIASPVVFALAYHLFPPARPALGLG